ncbi:MAG: ABC transporter substrate-binding protein [Candidatus Rokubacteria bacterium]|nr:ABC transporter substrate-binding protein [Candidatus Rokubacteria bacterium]
MPSRRRRLVRPALALLALAAAVAATPAADVAAQSPKRIPRIGFFGLGRSGPSLVGQAFRQGLADLGYVDGKTIVIEWRLAEADEGRLEPMARELVAQKVDVIVAAGTSSILAAKRATTTIPIVMANPGDPVATGIVASLARPGGNVTGVTNLSPEVAGKRLELLKEAIPRLTSVAVVRNPGNAEQMLEFQALQRASQALGVRLHVVEVRTSGDFRRVLAGSLRGRAEALVALGDSFTFAHRGELIEAAEKSDLPAIYGSREFVDAGGLMSYGPNLPDLFRRSAAYVDKILKGAKPADLPVEQPLRFELVVNRRAELLLGLTLPRAFLLRADHVIE